MKKKSAIYYIILLLLGVSILFSACKSESDKAELFSLSVTDGQGSGKYTKGAVVTVIANEPQEDYIFIGWEKNSVVISNEMSYSFKINADTVIKAIFSYPYSVWDGNVSETAPSSYLINVADKIVDIYDASAFAYWRSLLVATSATDYVRTFKGSTYNYTKKDWIKESSSFYVPGYTINLHTSIDLTGKNWRPIDAEVPLLDGCVINGNGYTIKGMKIAAQAPFAGVRGWSSGGFFTMVGSNQTLTIKNLNFKNAEITGSSGQLGVLIGGTYRSRLIIDNVNVYDSIVNGSSGGNAGILIGRCGNCNDSSGDHEKISITNCTVKNTILAGRKNIGVFVGAVYSSSKDYANATWKQHYGTTSFLPNFRVFDNTTAWWTDAIQKLTDIKNGIITNDTTWDTETVNSKLVSFIDLKAQVVAEEDAAKANDISKNLYILGNTVKDNTIITYDVSNYKSGWFYTYNEDKLDDAKTLSYDQLAENVVEDTNKKIDTKSCKNNIDGVTPIYVTSEVSLLEMFNSYKFDTEEDDKYLNREIYIVSNVDFTKLFKENDDFDNVVLSSGVKFILLNGAQFKGIPDGVLKNASIVNFK